MYTIKGNFFIKYLDELIEDGNRIYNTQCNMTVGNYVYGWFKLNGLKMTIDNTKYIVMPLPGS